MSAAPDGRPTMTAAVYRRFGGPDVVSVEQVPIPTPKPDEVLIRVHASTVSIADHRSRTRDIPKGLGLLAAFGLGVFRPRHPILGMDVAGVVESTGSAVTKFRPGDRVIALLGDDFGGHAQYARISQDGPVALAPTGMSFDEAVTLVFGGTTMHRFFTHAQIGPGTRMLVNGASGACGTAAIMIAKARGAHVTAVTSGKNAELVTQLGADEVIDYTTTDFATTGDAYDVIAECVGNAPYERVKDVIRPGGALLMVIVDLGSMLRSRGQSRRSGKNITAGDDTNTGADLAELVALAESGQYRPVIDRTSGSKTSSPRTATSTPVASAATWCCRSGERADADPTRRPRS